MNAQLANLERLEKLYCGDAEKPAAEALSLVKETRTPQAHDRLAFLLRNHEKTAKPIKDRETWERWGFDEALDYFSLLEVASCCGEVPEELPEELYKYARNFLETPAVLNYYITNYPQQLPNAFRSRLNGKPVIPWGEFSEPSSFGPFFEFTAFERADVYTPIETFCMFLEDGSREDEEGEWVALEDTIEAVKSPERLVECLAASEKDSDHLELSVQGLVEFLEFCRDFDEFLRNVDRPMQRSLFWHFFSHWFVRLHRKVGDVLDEAVLNIASWENRKELFAESNDQKIFENAVLTIRQAIKRLCGEDYRWEFEKLCSIIPNDL